MNGRIRTLFEISVAAIGLFLSVGATTAQPPRGNEPPQHPTVMQFHQMIIALDKDLSQVRGTGSWKEELKIDELKQLLTVAPEHMNASSAKELRAMGSRFDAYVKDPNHRIVTMRPSFQAVHRGLDHAIAALPIVRPPTRVVEDHPKPPPPKPGPGSDPSPAQKTYGNLVVTDCPNLSKKPFGGHRGNLLVLVNSSIYPSIKPSIATYANDLAMEGYRVTVRTVNEQKGAVILGRSYWYLKYCIQEWWSSSINGNDPMLTADEVVTFVYHTGVVLVGDLPVAEVHQRFGEWTDDNGGKHPYEGVNAIDIFLTDLNGNWSYIDPSFNTLISTYDSVPPPDSECNSTDTNDSSWIPPPAFKLGKAGAQPEIFLGRINAKHVAQVNGVYSNTREIQLLQDYFARNHAYRTNPAPTIPLPSPTPPPSGKPALTALSWPRLAYYDDGWAGKGPIVAQDFQQTWRGQLMTNDAPDSIDIGASQLVNSTTLTNKADYLKRLGVTQHLWVDLMSHCAGSSKHAFEVPNGYDYLDSWEVAAASPKSYFYYLQGCSGCDYRQDNNLGETYLFRGNALGVVGNTTAGPLDTAQFYVNIGQGMSLGEAVMIAQQLHGKSTNWPTNFASLGDTLDPKRYYSVALLGDPTLKAPHTPALTKIGAGSLIIQSQLKYLLMELQAKSPQQAVAKLHASVAERIRLQHPEKLHMIKTVTVHGGDFTKVPNGTIIVDPMWQHYMDKGVRMQSRPVIRDFGFAISPHQP